MQLSWQKENIGLWRKEMSSSSTGLAEWENSTFCKILRVTLTAKTDATSSLEADCVHLKDLEADLKQSNAPLLLTSTSLDAAFFERLNIPFSGQESGFGYLVECYRSVTSIQESTKTNARTLPPGCGRSLEDLKKSIVSYSGLILSPTDMLEEKQQQSCLRQACTLLSKSMGSPAGFPVGFLQEVIAEIDEDVLGDVFTPIINSTIVHPSSINLFNCLRPLVCLQNITTVPALARLLAKNPRFNPKDAKNGMDLQNKMLLGPYLALTTNGKDPRFAVAQQRSQAITDTRARISNLQATVAAVLFNMLKSGPATQDIVLDWAANIMRLNIERRKMHFNPNNVSSLGTTLTGFLLGKKNDRIDYSICTRLSATPADLEKLAKSLPVSIKGDKKGGDSKKKKFNMVTEMFFLTMETLQLGYIRSLQ
eukprot:1356054-Amorphochlora_amoeboformis.AAC.2